MKNNNTAPTIATRNNKQLDRLKTLLKELFQLDKPELDFGLYKIMHAKSAQISQFLDNDLLKEIEAAFGAESAGRVQQAEQKVAEALEQAKTFGAPDPEATQGVAQARAAYKLALEGGNTEAEIYDHLYRFFERYYDNGDFLSKRYYARENDSRAAPYSVPYDGREVYLHWANKDQYYIKSGEYLNNFSFDLTEAARLHREAKVQPAQALDFGDTASEGQPLKVHMHLAQAQEGEHGNIKAASDQKREFIPLLSRPVEFNDLGELVLNFEYKALPEGYPIDAEASAALMSQYEFKNKGDVPAHWMADLFLQALQALPKADARYLALLAETAPTDTQKGRPLLAKYIQQYTARNTMDYFIHKDLGGFLKRELDFYVKNELMRLDDIESAEAPRVEQYLGKIRALRRIAHQLIAFLAQLEDFQKKLWLKKKFVTETHYCITLDRVPESLYPAIAANEAQREEWVKLFAIDEIAGDTTQVGYSVPLTVDFLKGNPFLLVDTALFDDDFKAELLTQLENLDRQCDGVLIHSENFQALNITGTTLKSKIKCIHIDPPYNTATSGFVYKNNYQHSSWLSMMADRIRKSVPFLQFDGDLICHIDENEYENLFLLLSEVASGMANAGTVIWDKRNPMTGGKGIANQHEYILWRTNQNRAINFSNAVATKIIAKAKELISKNGGGVDSEVKSQFSAWVYANEEFSGGEKAYRYLDDEGNVFQSISLRAPEPRSDPKFHAPLIHPKTGKACAVPPNGFSRTPETLHGMINKGEIIFGADESTQPRQKSFLKIDTVRQLSSLLADAAKGKATTSPMGLDFPYCHPVGLYENIITLATGPSDYSLDYFGGSGTSGHAVINLNRLHKSKRKYVMFEMGTHFETTLKPRIQKAAYSATWKDGKPVARDGISHCFKYLRLESYEDTLNNLSLQADPARERALADNPALRQDYVLNYWLDVETQGSQSLLNVANFRDPTAYTMRIKQPGSDVQRMQRIDLIETFNWLIGLWVEHMAAPQTLEAEFTREVDPLLPKDQNTRLVCKRIKRVQSGASAAAGSYWFRLVEGYTLKVPGDDSSRQKTLVVWRKLTDNPEQDNAVLQHFLMEKLAISPREQTYAVIYVNGSHTLPNPVVEGEQTKVRLIEEAFHKAMWSQDGA